MQRGKLIIAVALSLLMVQPGWAQAFAQQEPVAATFRSSVDLVRVTAVVRDRRGRFVRDLAARDFEILEGGLNRDILDLRRDSAGISVALLFDVSGSMEARLGSAREAATHVLSRLDAVSDEAAVFTFDTRLDELTPFTTGLRTLPDKLAEIIPFGATSLHDAIAKTAERLGDREGRRRAVIVFTDGRDNASRLSAGDVSGIASAIDVPVYVVGIAPSIDNPSADMAATTTTAASARAGRLADLATWTGGQTFVASTPAERSAVALRIVEELRHQYLIAFESSGRPGWHPLVVRARDKDLTVRARSGYIAGQSRPMSQ